MKIAMHLIKNITCFRLLSISLKWLSGLVAAYIFPEGGPVMPQGNGLPRLAVYYVLLQDEKSFLLKKTVSVNMTAEPFCVTDPPLYFVQVRRYRITLKVLVEIRLPEYAIRRGMGEYPVHRPVFVFKRIKPPPVFFLGGDLPSPP